MEVGGVKLGKIASNKSVLGSEDFEDSSINPSSALDTVNEFAGAGKCFEISGFIHLETVIVIVVR